MSLIRKGKNRPVLPITVPVKKTGENLIKAKHLREQLIKSDEKFLSIVKAMDEQSTQLKILSEKVDTLIQTDTKVHEEQKQKTDEVIEDANKELTEKIKTTEDEK